MEVQQLLHMNGGEGKHSYASNSLPQSSMMARTRPYIEEALQKVLSTTESKKLNVADLGCSSGPNALLAVDMILDIVNRICSHQPVDPSLELHAFLNDLPGNDFNTVFKALPSFYQKVRGNDGTTSVSCFISATPGSFHGRLFPCQSLHFVYSANSLHWLSQVPPELTGVKGNQLNKRNIGQGKTSPPAVLDSYLSQFQRDVTIFLKSRSEEIVHGGRMVLLLKGRKSLDNSSDERDALWTTFASAFEDLIREGVVEEDKVNSFNMPCYDAYIEELREIIRAEGSFDIVRMEALAYAGQNDINKFTPELVTNSIRAFSEPLLVNHFGVEVMDILFEKFREKLPPNDPLKVVTLVVSLARKK